VPNIVKCPACRQALKLGDASAGKRVRCPACKHPFTAPAAEEPEEIEEVEEVLPERSPRKSEKDVPPRPRRRSRDEEEDRPRRGRRGRDEDEDEVVFSRAPLVYGILSCVISCAFVISYYLGWLAVSKADEEMAKLPGGKRSRPAVKSLRLAARLGYIGQILSVVWLVLALVLKILGWVSGKK
jgi:hypothetical protein